jgi:lactoylglutathione lyase
MPRWKQALSFADEAANSIATQFRLNRAGGQPAGSEIAFVTDDVMARFKAAIAAGATSFAEPAEKPWGQTVSYVLDLNGYLVEICSPVGAPA